MVNVVESGTDNIAVEPVENADDISDTNDDTVLVGTITLQGDSISVEGSNVNVEGGMATITAAGSY